MSHIKINEILIHAIMLMNLENIVSGKTQTKKATYYIIQLHKIHKVSKPIESEGTIMVVRG